MAAPEQDARDWLDARTRRTLTVAAIAGLLTIFTVVTPIFIAFVAWMHHRHAHNLQTRGVMLRATLTGLREDVTRIPATAAEAWEDIDHGIPDGGQANVMALVHAAIMLIHPLVAMLGHIVPILIVRYTFELGGSHRTAGRYMFADERFYRDDDGAMWVWVDPKFPTLNTWMISTMD